MRELFEYLAANKVSPNGLFVLHSVYNKYYFENYINTKTELYRLELSGYVKSEKVDGRDVVEITSQGLLIIREAEKIAGRLAKQKEKKSKIPFEEWKEKIDEYNNIFPKGRKEGSSISFRTPPKELYVRFIWFFAENPEYDWDLVMKATRQYAQAFEQEGDYTYMQTSKYFIKKEDRNKNVTSTLGSICYNILEGNDEDISTTGHYYFGP
jgi:hypothetical protein